MHFYLHVRSRTRPWLYVTHERDTVYFKTEVSLVINLIKTVLPQYVDINEVTVAFTPKLTNGYGLFPTLNSAPANDTTMLGYYSGTVYSVYEGRI